MADFIIIPDVNCDLSKDLRDRFQIQDYLSAYCVFPSGEEKVADLTWNEISEKEFYIKQKDKKNKFTTSPASPEDYINKFESYLKKGIDVLSLSISSGLSGTYNFTLVARTELLKKYPDRKIICIDTNRYSLAFGLLVILARQKQLTGNSIEEVADWINNNKNCVHQSGTLDDLFYVARAGRISMSKAFMGTLIGIKPLGEVDENGLTTVLAKVKGFPNCFKYICNYIDATATNPSEQIIIVAHSNREAQAIELKKILEDRYHSNNIFISNTYISTTINMGPGLLAAFYMGKPISKDLVEEREIANRIVNEL